MKKFAGSKNPGSIPKFDLDPDGNPVTSFNKRTMARKAFQAFLKGRRYYRYKGVEYVVPTVVDIEKLKKDAGRTED